MATSRALNCPTDDQIVLPNGTVLPSLEEAVHDLSRDERFMAVVYALNTLLVQKGLCSPDEISFHVREWAAKQRQK